MENSSQSSIIIIIIILITIPIIILLIKVMEEGSSIVLIKKICYCKVNSYLLNKKRLNNWWINKGIISIHYLPKSNKNF